MGAADSVFAKIVAGQIPCQRVAENEHALAFLDVNPLAEGHTLVVPRRPVERLEELPPDDAAGLTRLLIEVAGKVVRAVGAAGYNVLQNNGAVAGQEVPHVHFHIIPRRAGDGLGYRWRPQKADPDALKALAERIRGTA